MIRDDVPPQSQAAGLIQELVHAFATVFTWGDKSMDEEGVALRIETAFTSLVRDNPRLLGVLRKALAGKAPIV